MKVKRTEIKKLFLETPICEECDAEMISTGNFVACNPPEYELTCPKCGKKEYIRERMLKVDDNYMPYYNYY